MLTQHYKLSLLISFLTLFGCASQNASLIAYNEEYNCQIEGGYSTQIYAEDAVNIKDELAYDKDNNLITGVVVKVRENKSCYTKYYEKGKKVKTKDVKPDEGMIEEEIIEENGIVKNYQNGKYIDYLKRYDDGRVEFYYPEGQIKAVDTATNGNGSLIMYYPNGKIESTATYKNNKEDGESYWYYPNGNVEIAEFYKNGKLEGKKVKYHNNGVKRQEWNYKNDRLNGLAKLYTKKGNLLVSMNFIDGLLTGEVKVYLSNKVQTIIKYNKNKAVEGYYLNKYNEFMPLNKKALQQLDLSHFNKQYINKNDDENHSNLRNDENNLHDELIYQLMNVIKNKGFK